MISRMIHASCTAENNIMGIIAPVGNTQRIENMKDIELFNDNYQNWKRYLNCKAQLIIADVPYNLANKAYASNPSWYIGGDNKNGESEKAGKSFFNTDENFKPAEFMHFCSQLLLKEPKNGLTEDELNNEEFVKIKDEKIGSKCKSQAPCMVLFCAFDQLHYFIELGQRYGFKHYIPLVFRKNYSPQVLKANMKIVGNTEYGLVLYKNKLPKFNNNGAMIFNCIDYPRDYKTPKVHPTQKSVPLLEFIIELFTDKGDVVIDPCAGSGTTLLAAANKGRKAYGFEIDKKFYKLATEKVLTAIQPSLF